MKIITLIVAMAFLFGCGPKYPNVGDVLFDARGEHKYLVDYQSTGYGDKNLVYLVEVVESEGKVLLKSLSADDIHGKVLSLDHWTNGVNVYVCKYVSNIHHINVRLIPRESLYPENK